MHVCGGVLTYTQGVCTCGWGHVPEVRAYVHISVEAPDPLSVQLHARGHMYVDVCHRDSAVLCFLDSTS